MKVIKELRTRNGTRRVTVELDGDERILAVRPNAYYRLGDPVSDVMIGHVMEGAVEVSWCSVDQQWVE